jgi:hypothetical protein
MAMDFMAGPAAAGGGGPPPDLAALLGGGGPGGGTPPAEAAAPQEGMPTSEADALDAILQAVEAYMGLPSVDEGERLQMEKVTTIVQQVKAQNQKMEDQVTGASPSLRKALAGA